MKSIRSKYASIVLCLYYIEIAGDFKKSIEIIKTEIKISPRNPITY